LRQKGFIPGEKAIPEIVPTEEKFGLVMLSWNKENPIEIASAEKTFKEYTRKGWLAFIVTSDNKKKQVFTFDPDFEKIQLVRLVEGG
jgi:hypothetical protein